MEQMFIDSQGEAQRSDSCTSPEHPQSQQRGWGHLPCQDSAPTAPTNPSHRLPRIFGKVNVAQGENVCLLAWLLEHFLTPFPLL